MHTHAKFSTQELVGGGTLVEGTDVTGATGKTILVSDTWQMVKQARLQEQADEIFTAGVNVAMAPILAAAEEIRELFEDKSSSWSDVVIKSAVDGEAEVKIHLDTDGTILRLLEETDASMLRWVGDLLVAVKA